MISCAVLLLAQKYVPDISREAFRAPAYLLASKHPKPPKANQILAVIGLVVGQLEALILCFDACTVQHAPEATSSLTRVTHQPVPR